MSLMCGRYVLKSNAPALADQFEVALDQLAMVPRFNIAPTQGVLALVQRQGGAPSWQMLRWGLIPAWSKDAAAGNKLFNARSETVWERASFRNAIKHRRCLIVADGFYEWKRLGAARTKQPYLFYLTREVPFAFAGLWEVWHNKETGEDVGSCTILTSAANELVADVHDRMPVIVRAEWYRLWLDADVQDAGVVDPMLTPYPAALMRRHAVSGRVNSVRNDDEACIVAVDDEPRLLF